MLKPEYLYLCIQAFLWITMMLSFVDGQVADSISIDDRGLAYGDGCFTTALIIDGGVVKGLVVCDDPDPGLIGERVKIAEGLGFDTLIIDDQQLKIRVATFS